MKHTLLTILFAVCSFAASAQTPKFFGVPVGNTRDNFVNALRYKGMKLEYMGEQDSKYIYRATIAGLSNDGAVFVMCNDDNMVYGAYIMMYENKCPELDIINLMAFMHGQFITDVHDSGGDDSKEEVYLEGALNDSAVRAKIGDYNMLVCTKLPNQKGESTVHYSVVGSASHQRVQ